VEMAKMLVIPEGMDEDTPGLEHLPAFEEANKIKLHRFLKDVQRHGTGEFEQEYESKFPNEAQWPRVCQLHYVDREKSLDHTGMITKWNAFKQCYYAKSRIGECSHHCLECGSSFKTSERLDAHE